MATSGCVPVLKVRMLPFRISVSGLVVLLRIWELFAVVISSIFGQKIIGIEVILCQSKKD